MASYVGPARLVLDGEAVEVAVNLHSFVDLSSATGRAGWRGVVVDASFVPPTGAARRAEVKLPDGRGATGILDESNREVADRCRAFCARLDELCCLEHFPELAASVLQSFDALSRLSDRDPRLPH